MVFGWVKKKKEPGADKPAIKEASIELSKVDGLLQEQIRLKEKQTVAEVQKLRDRVASQLEELKKIIIKLEKDDLKLDEVDKNLRIIVNRGKKQVVSIIKKETSKQVPNVSSYEEAKSLNEFLHHMMKKIGEVLGRQARVIHNFAKKYVEKLKETVADLNSDVDEIKKIIDDCNTFEKNIENSSQLLSSIYDKEDLASNLERRIVDLEDDLEKTNTKITELGNEIKKIKESSEYENFQKTKNELDQKSIEKDSIRKTIQDQFTLISRPLSKYKNATRMDEHESLLLDKLIQEPYAALQNFKEDDIIVVLGKIRKGVETNLVSVKDVEKTFSNIDDTIEKISDFQSTISAFETNRSKLNEKLERFDYKNLQSKEQQLSSMKNKKEELGTKISYTKNDISTNKNAVPNILSELEINLQHLTGSKYKIIHSLKN